MLSTQAIVVQYGSGRNKSLKRVSMVSHNMYLSATCVPYRIDEADMYPNVGSLRSVIDDGKM
jgi:hypothetical protein